MLGKYRGASAARSPAIAKIHHFFHSELLLVPPEQGQNQRHVDMLWPLWNLLDFSPEGRGSDWYPSLSYR